MSEEQLVCVRCHKPVAVHRAEYEVFERMHWLCFHLEFEHHADPDSPCDDPSCPWWQIQVFEAKLRELDHDPQQVLGDAITARWKL